MATRTRSVARTVAEAGVIAAVYGAVSLITIEALQWFAFGLVQFRVSEALTAVALFTPAAVPGLWLGAVVANAIAAAQMGNPFGWLDVVFGGLGTLLGAWWTWRFRKVTWFGLLGPVVTNALIVPAYLPALLRSFGITGVPLLGLSLQGSWPLLYVVFASSVAFGQAVVVYGVGWPLLTALRRLGLGELIGG